MNFIKLFLFKASEYGDADVVNALLQAGSYVKHNDYYGDIALIYGI